MSYILEALKKSQQERELGQIPTLDSGALFSEDKEPPPVHHWGLLAVGLAALAVVIALYAAFRGGDGPAAGAGAPVPSASAPTVVPAPAEAPATPPTASTSTAAPGAAPVIRPPLVEAPPPRPAIRASRPEVLPPAADPGPRLGGMSPPEAGAERELQRQLDAGQVYPEESDDGSLDQPRPVPIPPDLIEDIENFKQQVRRGQGSAPPAAAAGRSKPAAISGDPTRLRLTPQQQAQLPAYLMTVHVYDEQVSKRFVVINSLKYGEGEDTREGLRVERILHDGAVLSYQGNPFYVPR